MRTLLAAVLLASLPAAQDPGVEDRLHVDFVAESRRGLEVVKTACDGGMHGPLVLRRPGQSVVGVEFRLPAQPASATVVLDHLAAGVPSAPRGGVSVYTLSVNGEVVGERRELDRHGFGTDSIDVASLLKAGDNRLELSMVDGTAAWWIRRIELRAAFANGTVLDRVERNGAPASYAVVVSRRTWQDEGWRKVVDALVSKHRGFMLVCDREPADALAELRKHRPAFACFVARAAELGRDPVVAIHRMTRRLDDDPYTDVRWGILTGVDAGAALAVARTDEPLTVRRGAAGCGLELERFESGTWFSEGEKNLRWTKEKGAEPRKGRCEDDSTAEIVAELNAGKPDCFVTSGHATERDWQIGYSYPNGQFRCEGGALFGLDLAGRRHPIDSSNPKVYLASGNCRMGLVPDTDAMALAWMKSGGARQMIGYVVSTWHGAAGWGVKEYFLYGGLSLSDAFFANTQWMIRELETRFPRTARVDFEDWGIETDHDLIGRLAKRHGLTDQAEVGLLWDRDTLAFYGDPAWTARVAAAPEWTVSVTPKDGRVVVEAVAAVDAPSHRPPFAWLPRHQASAKLLEGDALVTDDFVLFRAPEKAPKGTKLRVVVSIF